MHQIVKTRHFPLRSQNIFCSPLLRALPQWGGGYPVHPVNGEGIPLPTPFGASILAPSALDRPPPPSTTSQIRHCINLQSQHRALDGIEHEAEMIGDVSLRRLIRYSALNEYAVINNKCKKLSSLKLRVRTT